MIGLTVRPSAPGWLWLVTRGEREVAALTSWAAAMAVARIFA